MRSSQVNPATFRIRSRVSVTAVTLCCVIHVVTMPHAKSQCNPTPLDTEAAPCPDTTECGARVVRCLCDNAGHIVLEDTDRNGDGRSDTRIHLSYSSEGNLVLREVDRGVDGSIEERHLWEYEDGVLQTYEIDRDGDCQVDSRTSYYTDEDRHILWEDNDTDADGVIEERIMFAYDGEDRVGRVVDVDADGRIERECDYDPPCPPPYSWEECSRFLYCHDVPAPRPVARPVYVVPDGPPDNIYIATIDELCDESSELRSSLHTLILFSVDEEAAGWECWPCDTMHSYFSWRAGDTLREGVWPPSLRYVLVEITPRELETRPPFLLDDIVGWPTIVHLVADQPTEILEDRIRGLNMRGLRDLVRSVEAEYRVEPVR